MLSICGGVASNSIAEMVSSPIQRNAFIESTIEVARRFDFDGLDLWWTFPTDSTDMENLAILLGEWRAAIHNEASAEGKAPLLLTAAVYYSAEIMWSDTLKYPAESINENMDWVNVRCYDYHWGSFKTGAHAALYDTSPDNKSTKYGLEKWISAGVLAEKLVMGFTLHGRTWTLLHPNTHGIGAPAEGVGPGDYGTLTFSEVEKFNRENGATVVHDEQTGSTYSFAGTSWISYNDEISAKSIIKFAKDLRLRGYFISGANGDSNWKISRNLSTIWEKRVKELEIAPNLWLYKAVLNVDWDVAKQSLDPSNGRIAANEPVSMFYDNVIHVIAKTDHGTEFLRRLVNDPNLNQDVLLEKDADGTPHLFWQPCLEILGRRSFLVEKNPALLTIPDSNGTIPVYVAAMYGDEETVRYLIDQTIRRNDYNFDGPNGVYLLNLLITEGFYVIAESLLKRFPRLAHWQDSNNSTPLQTLAELPRNLWQRDEQGKAVELIRRICKAMFDHAVDNEKVVSDFFWDPLLTAAKLGNHEIVKEIINVCPYIVWFTDDDAHECTIHHYAVMHRHEKIFNLIRNLGSNRYRIANKRGTDNNNNNILHLAATLEVNATKRVSGAALQMQRELQWYKEIEKLVPKSFQEEKDMEGMTPGEVFTRDHEKLVKAGEEWMQKTASASTLVAALIVTVVFAAAFTVPGGNDSTGVPIFLQRSSFIVFAISNAIALFSSSTSLMMFLGILNSRYSEIDFLHSLPNKLIIGLCTLFLSILCMLIAFSAALQLYLGHLSNFVIIPIVLGTCIPVILFGFLQFPLLKEISYSTYGPSIFCHEAGKLDYTGNQPTQIQAHLPALTPSGSFVV